MTSVKGSALGLTLPDVIPGTLKVSKIHTKFIYTEMPGLAKTFADIVEKLEEIAPEFGWRVHMNSHGPHSSALQNGEKKSVDITKVAENTPMVFRVTGCGFRVSEPLDFSQFFQASCFIL